MGDEPKDEEDEDEGGGGGGAMGKDPEAVAGLANSSTFFQFAFKYQEGKSMALDERGRIVLFRSYHQLPQLDI